MHFSFFKNKYNNQINSLNRSLYKKIIYSLSTIFNTDWLSEKYLIRIFYLIWIELISLFPKIYLLTKNVFTYRTAL